LRHLPYSVDKALEERLPNAKLAVPEKAKHCVTEGRPSEVVELIATSSKDGQRRDDGNRANYSSWQ